MNSDLKNSIPDIENALSKDYILKFKIGITGKTKERQFQDHYSENGFILMTIIAYGENEVIVHAVQDLIGHFLNSPAKEKCLNDTKSTDAEIITNVDKLYIVAKKKNCKGIDTSLPPSELLLMQEISLY